MKRDVPLIGFIYGLLLPVLGLMAMYLWWGKGLHHLNFNEFFSRLSSDHEVLARVLTMSLLINLIPFVYCNYRRYDYSMRGVVIATMLYAVVIVLLKFVW
ncbi:MAG: hypothetical protein K0Q79_131 [Flavipsychrobacter sp.]|jgi:hypothetical protein|nr:hypothetical protein [Flavipsychrobacter sp.]